MEFSNNEMNGLLQNWKPVDAIPIMLAPSIAEDSWLKDAEYESFRNAYGYASTQSRAIIGLSKVTPEDAYFIYEAIERGLKLQKSI